MIIQINGIEKSNRTWEERINVGCRVKQNIAESMNVSQTSWVDGVYSALE